MSPIYAFFGEYRTGHECLGATIFVGSVVAIGSTLCSLILVPLDRRRVKVLKQAENRAAAVSVETQRPPETIKLKDFISFPIQLWLIIIIALVFYSVTFPFISLSKLYFIKKYSFSTTVASLQQSLFFLGTVVTSPIFGKIVDLTGYNLYWIVLSLVTATAAHAVFMFTFINSFVPVVMLGMSLSLIYASLWPMVSVIVSNHQLATAYGLMQSFQNLGLAITNILVGIILQNYGYFALEMFFLLLSICEYLLIVLRITAIE